MNITRWMRYPTQEDKKEIYRKISDIRRTKSQILNVPGLGMQLSLRNVLKPSVKWKMKM